MVRTLCFSFAAFARMRWRLLIVECDGTRYGGIQSPYFMQSSIIGGEQRPPWESISQEIKQYSRDSLQQMSQRKYDTTKAKYTELIQAMKKAESKLEPALIPLRYQALFMKHNLNAKAIAGLSDELVKVETNVDTLVREMESSVAQADKFIASMKAA